MSMQKVSVLVPPLSPVPRGAVLAEAVIDAVFDGAARLRAWLAARHDQRRDRQAIVRAARRDARDRTDLLALAHRYESSQPEFAKDLFAAAKRDLRA